MDPFPWIVASTMLTAVLVVLTAALVARSRD
jgi:hypothetical protein